MDMNKRRPGILIFGFLLLLAGTSRMALAQQAPVFSQYYFNELVINPAYAGAHVQLSLTSMYRNQWVNFPGAPRTFSFSGHTALYNGKVGVGLLVNNDKIGSYNNQSAYAYYAYKIRFYSGTLSMGLQGGFNFLGADFSKLDLTTQGDASFSSINIYKPNFGAGLYYNQKNFFVGFSVPYLINKSATPDRINVSQITEARYYFLRSGVIVPLNTNKSIKLNPSILVRAQDGQPLSMDINAGFIFIDIQISEKFHFAYSYDWTSSDISRYSNGSHEFMINYRAKVTKAQKGTACPTFFQYGTLGPSKRKRFNREKK